LPLPLLPPVTVIHEVALLAAVQLQPPATLTLTLPLPPPAAGLAFDGEMMYVHTGGWLTVKVFPAIVMVPVLAEPVLLADTV